MRACCCCPLAHLPEAGGLCLEQRAIAAWQPWLRLIPFSVRAHSPESPRSRAAATPQAVWPVRNRKSANMTALAASPPRPARRRHCRGRAATAARAAASYSAAVACVPAAPKYTAWKTRWHWNRHACAPAQACRCRRLLATDGNGTGENCPGKVSSEGFPQRFSAPNRRRCAGCERSATQKHQLE